MLKKEVTYENFDGEKVTEAFYFNVSEAELMEMQFEHEEGFDQFLTRIVKAENISKLIKEFKKLLLFSYGVKSEDGKRFIKSDKLREEFEQTAAYSKLFMELATNDKAAAEFINGVIPKSLADLPDQDKPTGPPPSPQTFTPGAAPASLPTPPVPPQQNPNL